MIQQEVQSHIIGLHVTRSCAILFVIAGQFFSPHTAYQSSLFEGVSLFIQAIVCHLFQIGIPLFIILTGYLNINKTITKKHYKDIIRVLVSYIVFSLITIVFRKYYLSENLSWTQWGLKILDFSAIPYAWYIEMWIGLFTLTPFLNILYKAIPTKTQKKLLLISLFAITALPDWYNRYGLHLVPGFWQQCFPLTFYFIGAYIQEYKPTIPKRLAGGIILGICLIDPVFNFLFVHNQTLIQVSGGPSGIFGVPMAILFFLVIYRVQIQNKILQKTFTKLSILSLNMYLCCYIFDTIYYPYFKEHYFVNQSQFGSYFFAIVPLVFMSSFIMAWLIKIGERQLSS